eukprot:CAMPEP_0170482512 /NCGR_PEP_ID=MMETSP0208-20121228/2500_1 /TAXON_ID=197538 /ORGANISM="Strombidium inclinatum, Strain S3" /LENGTH=154 /DNA_ID=CAMNT_0010755359 /DNA_START=89 /DNA_END=556 /DNA_ORIENTATION=-
MTYKPNKRDSFIHTKSGDKFQRLVWGSPIELSKRESDYMADFLKYIEDNKLEPLPSEYTMDDRLAFRFMQGSYWDWKNSHAAIMSNKAWMAKHIPVKSDTPLMQKLLDSGMVYIAGRVKPGFQPIMVVNGQKFVDMEVDLEQLQEFAIFYFWWI